MKRAYVYLLATAAQALSPLVLLPLQRLSLGSDEAGYAILATAVASSVGLVSTLGLADAMMRRRLSGEVSEESSTRLLHWSPVAASAPALIAVAVLAAVGDDLAPGHSTTLVLGAFAGIPIAVLLVTQQYLRADERTWAFFANVVLWQLGTHLAALAAARGSGATRYAAAWLMALSVVSLFAVVRAGAGRRAAAVGARGQSRVLDDLRTSIAVGLPVLLHQLVGSAVLLLDRSVLAHFHGGESVTLYQAVYQLGMASVVVLASVNAAWGVRVFKSDTDRRWANQSIESRLLAAGALMMFSGIVLVARPILGFLAGTDKVNTAALLAVALLACVGITQVAYTTGLNSLYFVGATKSLARRTVPSSGAQALVSVCATPTLGVVGPALAAFLAQSAQAALVWRAARKRSPMRPMSMSLKCAIGFGWISVTALTLTGFQAHWIVGASGALFSSLLFLGARRASAREAD